MKLIRVILIFLFIGCQEKKQSRYFLVSYSTQEESSSNTIQGCTWFSVNNGGFPLKTQIDSMVFNSLPLKRTCYQNVVIISMFEFKSEGDFNAYDDGAKGDTTIKNKQDCSSHTFLSVDSTGMIIY